MVGSREAAEDITQEAFLRMWRSAPLGLGSEQQVAWLNRTATNLGLDELRGRIHRDHDELEESAVEALAADGAEALAVRDALERISANERLLVLLRFQAGLTHEEVADLLAIKPDAARKRVARARRAFVGAYRGTQRSRRPLILLETKEDPVPYVRWLERAGAEVRRLRPGPVEAQISLAGGIVFIGSVKDVDPSAYGQRPRVKLDSDLAKDRRELSIARAAMDACLPMVGVCRGAQLMNVALGGTLYQDVQADGVTRRSHMAHPPRASTPARARSRGGCWAGATSRVPSEHHQAVDRHRRRPRREQLGSDDSVFAKRWSCAARHFAIGLQWHPEDPDSGEPGRRIGDALIDAASMNGITLRVCGEAGADARARCAESPSATAPRCRKAAMTRSGDRTAS